MDFVGNKRNKRAGVAPSASHCKKDTNVKRVSTCVPNEVIERRDIVQDDCLLIKKVADLIALHCAEGMTLCLSPFLVPPPMANAATNEFHISEAANRDC
jgi:hypothetical protein